jgi:cytidine deaminase
MRTQRGARRGDGTAWLVADRSSDRFDCYWYTGTNDGELVEQAGAATADDAVAWGRVRTPRVRIRTRAGQTQWAGTDPRPATFAVSWNQA